MSDNQGKHVTSGGGACVEQELLCIDKHSTHNCTVMPDALHSVCCVQIPIGLLQLRLPPDSHQPRHASRPHFMAEEVECPRQSVCPWGPVSQSLSIPFLLNEPAKTTGLSSHPTRPTNGDRNNPLQGSRALWRAHGAVSPSRTRGLKNKQAPRWAERWHW